MKKCILVFLFLVVSFAISAQNDNKIDKFNHNLYYGKLSNKDFFKKADFIFEGDIVKCETYLSTDSSQVYRHYILRINEIYKGKDKLQLGTIQLIQNSGQYINFEYENGIDKSFSLESNIDFDFSFNHTTIFFCVLSDFPTSPLSFQTNNAITLKLLENVEYAGLNYTNAPSDKNFEIYGLNNVYLKDKDDLYQYMSQFKDIEIQGLVKKKADLLYTCKEFLEKQSELLKIAKRNVKTIGNGNSLTVNIDNQKVVYNNGLFYFQFDILVSANSNTTYLNGMICYLDYNTSVLGHQIVNSGNLESTLGADFSNGTYLGQVVDL